MATRKPRLTQAQKKMKALLVKRNGKTVSTAEILKETGWKPASWKTHVKNEQYGEYLTIISKGLFQVGIHAETSDWDFARAVSQSNRLRSTGHICKSPLAQELVVESQANFQLALELFNRPNLKNRVSVFCILFCNAWEQLLKAKLIEDQGRESIDSKTRKDGRTRTLSLPACLQKAYPGKSSIRQNVDAIQHLRDEATHLCLPNVPPIVVSYFRAGVLNYAAEFQEFTNFLAIPRSSIGCLAISHDPADNHYRWLGNANAGRVVSL